MQIKSRILSYKQIVKPRTTVVIQLLYSYVVVIFNYVDLHLGSI